MSIFRFRLISRTRFPIFFSFFSEASQTGSELSLKQCFFFLYSGRYPQASLDLSQISSALRRRSRLKGVCCDHWLTLVVCSLSIFRAALDIENRLRTETRLREMEQNPPKKFKGLLKIDGGVMRTEFEMRADSPDS